MLSQGLPQKPVPFRGWQRAPVTRQNGESVEAVCPLIVSASRATDIPAFYSPWLHNRLQAGYLRWINPFNSRQSQYVSLQAVRLIVFWSKNPRPLLPYLAAIEARGIRSCFHFTLNDYRAEGLEPGLPPLDQRIETFRTLSRRVGARRLIWRYDPLILSEALSIDVHLGRISRLAGQLQGLTERLVISFADLERYSKVRRRLTGCGAGLREFTPAEMIEFAGRLNKLNRQWGLKIVTCAEKIDLEPFGIEHGRCVDDRLIVELFDDDEALMNFLGEGTGRRLRDPGQRRDCGCAPSKDIGGYDSCRHGCSYCYACSSQTAVERRSARHDPAGESLIS